MIADKGYDSEPVYRAIRDLVAVFLDSANSSIRSSRRERMSICGRLASKGILMSTIAMIPVAYLKLYLGLAYSRKLNKRAFVDMDASLRQTA